jgi:hypothetical protein
LTANLELPHEQATRSRLCTGLPRAGRHD